MKSQAARLTPTPLTLSGPTLWIFSPHPVGRATKEHPPAKSTFQAADSQHPLPFGNVLGFHAHISDLVCSGLLCAALAVLHPQGWWECLLPMPASPEAALKMRGKHAEGLSHGAAAHLQPPAKVTRGNNKIPLESPFLCHLSTGRKHWKCLKTVFLMSSQPSQRQTILTGPFQLK